MSDNFTYDNDFLFKENSIMLNNVPNLYSALIKESDFYKGVPLHNTPYIKGKELNKYLDKIMHELPEYTKNNHRNMRKALKYYMKQRTTRPWRAYKKWSDSQTYPLVLIRIICKLISRNHEEEMNNLAHCLTISDNIVNSKNEGSLETSKLMNLTNENKAYIIGASFGDGCNLADGLKWQLTDGNKNLERLKYSRDYLSNINNLLHQEFGIRGKINRLDGNMYVLIINNKWFSRAINYFYDVPFGKKSYLAIPKIFNSDKLKNSFWSGVIDTDGQIFNNSANMQLCMKSKRLMEEFHEYLNLICIEHNFKHYRDEYYLLIPVRGFKKFSDVFKIIHPCKKMLLLNNLNRGTKQRIYVGKTGKTLKQFILNSKYIIKRENSCIKIGVHGGKFIKIPHIKDLDSVASRIRLGDRKIYIINRGKIESRIIADEIEKIFEIKPYYHRNKNTYYFNSDVLCDMFKYLYRYEKPW